MGQKLKLIYECVSYLEEQGYYGNIDLIYAVDGVDNPADHICERFTTPDGGEVLDRDYDIIKEWLEE